MNDVTVSFTKITTDYPVSKAFEVVEGKVTKQPAKPVGSGKAEVIETNLSGLAEHLEGFKANHVLALGVPQNGYKTVNLTTANRPEAGAIPRTRDKFKFNELALLPLDYDHGKFESTEQFDDAMGEILPGFQETERIYRQSATACIYQGDRQAFPNLNIHGYIIVKVNPDKAIEQQQSFKEIVRVRSWIAGHGYLFISKSGSVDQRCLVDLAVWARSEGLMYEGTPTVGDGLTFKKPKTRHIEGRPHLDISKIAPLTAEERNKYKELVRKQRNKQLPEINKKRKAYHKKMVNQIVSAGQVSEPEAEQITAHAMNFTLSSAWMVHLDDGRNLLIKDLIETPDEFDGVSMADPLEPDYGGGRCKAKFFWNNGTPLIHSHAHGGRTYKIGSFENEPIPEIQLKPEQEAESFFDKIQGCTGSFLMDMDFPEPRWVVEDIIPEGVFLLAGKPKAGKSVMALNVGVAVSTGGKYLGRDVEKGPVIYLHLEDNQRRIQTRLKAMLPLDEYSGEHVTGIEDLHLYHKWPRIGEGGLRALDQFCIEYKPKLIIIDTMKMFQPVLTAKDNQKVQSEIDYERIIALRPLAEKHSTTIMIVTHTRKAGADDPIDLISGTLGTAGATDNFLVLYERKGIRAKLWVQGRDVDQQEYTIEYTKEIWTWTMLGTTKDVAKTERQQAVLDYITEFGSKKDPVELSQIIAGCAVKKDYVKGKILPMLVADGVIQKAGRGKYYAS